MTETVQFRIQLPAALRDRFKTLCLRSNVTMTDRVVQMINREVMGQAPPSPSTPSRIMSLNDDRLIARVVDASDKLGGAAFELSTTLHRSFDEFSAKMLRMIPKPITAGHLAEQNERFAEQDQHRLDVVLDKVEQLRDRITATVERGQSDMLAANAAKVRLRHAFGTGAALGVAASAMLLWAISGTSPARSLAVSLIGGDSDWQAAKLIAGDGSRLRVDLMSETVALLRDPDFAKSYAQCISRAKAAKHNFKCTVRFTRLVEVK